MLIRFAIHYFSALIFASFLLVGCKGGGVRTIPTPEDEIMYLRNDDVSMTEIEAHERAEPLPLPILDGEPGLTFDQVAAAVPAEALEVRNPPYDSTAKFTFNKGSKPYYCSSQFVGQSDVLLTAAHCVYDRTWSNNFRIKTKYESGSSEEIFDWECAAIFSGWTKEKYDWDYAFVKVRGSASNTMSLTTSGVPARAESIGYPSNIAGGEILQGVTTKILKGTKNIMVMPGNPFGGGSSGGAWHDLGTIVSVNSHGYKTRPNEMYGPRFDGNVTKLYEFVEKGCRDAANSLVDSVEMPLTDNSGVVQSSEKLVDWGPVLEMRSTTDCSCGAKGIFLVNQFKSDYEVKLAIALPGKNEARNTSVISKPGGEMFLGCGLTKQGGKDCNPGFIVSITSASRIVENQNVDSFKSITLGDPEFCAESCSSGGQNGYCLNLGGEAAAIVAPLSAFVSENLRAAPDDSGVVATVPQMIKTFGGDPSDYTDPCKRSDFTSDGAIIENSGIGCRVSVKTENSQDLAFSLVTPTLSRGAPVPESSRTYFEQRSYAPQVEFLGHNGPQITAKYGGKVIAVEKESSRLIITTENGCLAAEVTND